MESGYICPDFPLWQKRWPVKFDFHRPTRCYKGNWFFEIACCKNIGAVVQLGERLNGIQEVRGSTPLGSIFNFL